MSWAETAKMKMDLDKIIRGRKGLTLSDNLYCAKTTSECRLTQTSTFTGSNGARQFIEDKTLLRLRMNWCGSVRIAPSNGTITLSQSVYYPISYEVVTAAVIASLNINIYKNGELMGSIGGLENTVNSSHQSITVQLIFSTIEMLDFIEDDVIEVKLSATIEHSTTNKFDGDFTSNLVISAIPILIFAKPIDLDGITVEEITDEAEVSE